VLLEVVIEGGVSWGYSWGEGRNGVDVFVDQILQDWARHPEYDMFICLKLSSNTISFMLYGKVARINKHKLTGVNLMTVKSQP
jgi:hypothetical protein